MKRLVLTALAVIAFGFTNAQSKDKSEGFSKGDVFITGSIGYFSSKSNGLFKDDTFRFSPKVGFFVTENIALGLGLSIFNQKRQQNILQPETKQNNLGFLGFGRYYFKPSSKFSIFGEAQISYETIKFEPFPQTINGFDITLATGFSYFLSDNFAIESTWGLLNYGTAKNDFPGSEASTSFNLGLNLSNANFGILYKF